MKLIVLLLVSLTLVTCEKTIDKTGYTNSVAFVDKYADTFLSSELIKYDYNLRFQYSYSINDTLKYRAGVGSETKELSAMFYEVNGFRTFVDQFKIPIKDKSNWERLRLKVSNSKYLIELESYDHPHEVINSDTVKAFIKIFGEYSIPTALMNDPIDYFQNLDKERIDYGIIDLRKLRIGGILEVSFSSIDYLLYFPPNMKIEEKRFQDAWDKMIRKGKKLKDNWYYYQREQPLDNG